MMSHGNEKCALKKLSVIRWESWLSRDPEDYRSSFTSEEGLKLECEVCDWYTRDASGEFQGHDKHFLKYLHIPENREKLTPLKFELRDQSEDDAYKFPMFTGNLNHFLQWIMSCDMGKQLLQSSNFICSRGALDHILCLPFRPTKSKYWHAFSLTLSAVKLGGKVYMVRKETDAHKMHLMQLNKKAFNSKKERLKFKQFMLSDDPSTKPDGNQPFVHSKQGVRVVTTLPFGGFNILYSSKLQGMPNSEALNDIASALLSSLTTHEYRGKDTFIAWRTWLGWWISASTKKADQVIVGRCLKRGTLKRIEIHQSAILMTECAKSYNEKYPKESPQANKKSAKKNVDMGCSSTDRRSGEKPQPSPPRAGASSSKISADDMSSMCLLSLKHFLDFVWEMTEPGIVLDFTWDIQDKDHMSCEPSQDSFIPQWYIEWINSNNLSL